MVTFFPSNPSQAAVAQTIYGGQSAEAIARIRAEETKAIARAQMQQQQQEGFWRQQQAQQQDALAREQLQSTDFFRRGQLNNQQADIAATLEANKSRDAATMAWRNAQLAPKLAEAEEAKAAEAQDMAIFGAKLGNLAKVRNDYDRLTADLAKLSGMETVQAEQSKLPEAPTLTQRMTKGTLGNLMTSPVPRFFGGDVGGAYTTEGFKPQATTGDGRKIPAMNLAPVRERMQSQLKQLEDIIKSNQELMTLLTKAPDGSWVPALPGAMPAPKASPFFNAPAPTMTNAPAVVPVAPPVTVAPATNSPALQRFIYVPGQGLVPR